MVLGTSGATLSLLEDGLARERLVSAMAAVFWRSTSQNCCVGQFFGLGRIVVLLRRVVSSGQPLPPKTHCVSGGLFGQFQVLPRTMDALAVRLKQFQVLLRTMDAFVVQTCTKVLGLVEVVCFPRDDCGSATRCWTRSGSRVVLGTNETVTSC